LLRILRQHRARPLILLLAPAGFGKTTTAAAYARESGASVAWITVRAGDEDSRCLFDRLRTALETTLGEGVLPALSRGLAEGADGSGLARLLIADLAHVATSFILVLDDYHVVQDAEEVHEAIDLLVRGLPAGGQVVIAAREPPPLSIHGLVADERVLVLGTEDLRFTPEETAILRRRLGGDPSRDTRAEGWVAGILLGGAPRQLGAADGSLVGTYVQREVLSRLPQVARHWLEALAVLETITPDAAARLLGRGPWPARLAGMADCCPFLVASGDGSYHLHMLVRDTLVHRLRRGRPDRVSRIWAAARALAEEAGDTAAAVRACQELGQIEDAVALVRRTAEAAMRAGRWTPALAALGLLPEAVRRAHPDLALAEAHALIQSGRPDPARKVAEAMLEQGAREGAVGIQVPALVELANIARYTGDLDAAQDWLAAADHLLLEARLPARQRRLLEGRLLGLRGVCAAVRGQPDVARQALEAAERVLLPGGTSHELGIVQYNLGTFCVRTGDYRAARAALAAAATQWRLLGDRGMLATTQLVLANLHLRTGDLDAAGASLARALEAARAAGALRTEAHGLVALGAWHRGYGRFDAAAASLDEAMHLAEEIGERELLVRALAQRAEVAALRGDLVAGHALLARAHSEAQRLESRVERAIVYRALGRLLLTEGAGQATITAFEDALAEGGEAWGPDERLAAWYWLGTAHLAIAQVHQAETALRQTLRLVQEVGVPVMAGPAAEDPRLLRYGRQIGLDTPTLGAVERLAAGRRSWSGAAPLDEAATGPAAAPRLEVRLFGTLLVHRDGVLVDPGSKRDRVRELFALLVLHPEGLPASEIAELLWPAMTPERAQHNLRMAVYLLRRFLGSKAAVRHATLAYRLAPQLELWVDARAFDEALKRARGAVDASARLILAEAIDLYRGPLLADAGWAWVEPFRRAYEARAATAALRLAELLAATDPDRSDTLAEQVLAIQPDNHAAFERLIGNAQVRGDSAARDAAIRRYSEMVSRLGPRPRTPLLRAI
jgi:LuxR family maltose regulon positive regulatory protein